MALAIRGNRPQSDGGNARIGPISVVTLVIVIGMAVLAVLAVSTANATLVMSQRLATSTDEYYLDDRAAQVFLAHVDAELGAVRAAGGKGQAAGEAIARSLEGICADAAFELAGEVDVTASFEEGVIKGEFTCHNGRVLKIEVAVNDDATYSIARWKMTAVENEEQPTGSLWTGA